MTGPGPGAAAPRDAAGLGPFFAFEVHTRPVPGPPWRPVREVVGDPAVLLERAERVRAHLAAGGGRPPETVELRVAASVTHLGLAARLLSPLLALAAVHRAAPDLDLDAVHWQPLLGGPFPLSLPYAGLRRAPFTPSGAARWAAGLVDGPMAELAGAAAALSVSRQVLWGNVASAVNAAAAGIAAAAPVHAATAGRLAALLLDHPRLARSAIRGTGATPFRRRNCCLIYRAAPGPARAVCGDCVLTARR